MYRMPLSNRLSIYRMGTYFITEIPQKFKYPAFPTYIKTIPTMMCHYPYKVHIPIFIEIMTPYIIKINYLFFALFYKPPLFMDVYKLLFYYNYVLGPQRPDTNFHRNHRI